VSGIAHREAYVFNVELTAAEKAFYEAVLEHARAEARASSATGMAPGWAGMMRERQAASSVAATREYLIEHHRTRGADLQVEASSSEIGADDEHRLERDDNVLSRLINAALAVGDTDSKYAKFEEALRQARDASPSSKIIVFSYFRRTLNYLERRLRDAGIRCLQINGSVAPPDRTVIIDRFKTDPDVSVLLTSEVGSEGLDFQFCDTLMNYDLPWNPMRVEQRIGRIDRYGQKAEKIRIYSFFLAGTIEERILERLYDKIGIFEESIGDLEPILGPLANQLTRDIFSMELTPQQEVDRTEQLLSSIEARRLDEESLEQRTAELLGQDALILQAINETVSSGRFISAAELRAVVEAFLSGATKGGRLEDLVGDGTVTIHTDPTLGALVADYAQRKRDLRPVVTGFLQKVHSQSRIAATFDGDIAALNRRLELLNQRHPLVRTAIEHARSHPYAHTPLVDLAVRAGVDASLDDVQPGTYRFAIQLLDVRSAQPQTRLETFAFADDGARVPAIEAVLLRVIQELATDHPNASWSVDDRTSLETHARQAAAVASDVIEAEAVERNEATIAVRTAALKRTYGARITKRRAQIGRATDERIIRMWQSEVRRAEEELVRKVSELEATRSVSVTFQPVGYGRLWVLPPDVRTDKPAPLEPKLPEGPITVGGFPEPPVRETPWA
jgi:hypothetical protein